MDQSNEPIGVTMNILFVAALSLCSLYIPPGGNYVINTAHYEHLYPQDGVFTWSSSVGMWVLGPTRVYAGGQGHPVAFSLEILGGDSVECGEIPDLNRIFSDGFETGDTSQWHVTNSVRGVERDTPSEVKRLKKLSSMNGNLQYAEQRNAPDL